MSAEDWWRGASLLISVIGAIVSLWGPSIRYHLVGPKLKVTLKKYNDKSKGFKTVWRSEDKADEVIPMHFYHLEVANTRYFAPAENVQVFVTEFKKAEDEESNPRAGWISGPIQLAWQYTDEPQNRTIGAARICDLGHLEKRESPHQSGFKLQIYKEPANFENLLKGHERWCIEIRALAENAESKPLYLDIIWNGGWQDETETLESGKILIVETIKKEDFDKPRVRTG
jgi:hypothetical protein